MVKSSHGRGGVEGGDEHGEGGGGGCRGDLNSSLLYCPIIGLENKV